MWLLYACASAFFAGMTAVLGKLGVASTDSTLATALRTIIIAVGAWGMTFMVGSTSQVWDISARTLVFLVLSGLATGASWLCYFAALARGAASRVAPIDKFSTVVAVVLALIILGEPISLIGVVGIVLISAGTLLMIEQSDLRALWGSLRPADAGRGSSRARESLSWLVLALASAFFAALTSILGKIGIEGVESNLGTAVRTLVVLVMAWGIAISRGQARAVKRISRRELLFIVASGAATCASWLAYYRALHDGPASVVVPVDKLSILVTVVFSAIVFHERFTPRYLSGLGLMVAGTLAMIL